MPVEKSLKGVLPEEEALLRTQLLQVIKSEEEPLASDSLGSESDWAKDLQSEFQKEGQLLHTRRLQEYEALIQRSSGVKLSSVLSSDPEGRILFQELCLRLDINESYASILPGWKDLAGILRVEDLKTRWVEACVRPIEGLTRAILEIYTRDGGTLDDVLSALLQMECLQILESLKHKVTAFLDVHEVTKKNQPCGDPYFSLIKGIPRLIPPEDPVVHVFNQFSHGLKHYQLCQGSSQPPPPYTVKPVDVMESLFTSDLKEVHSNKREMKKNKLNILLLFASDGVAYGSGIQSLLHGYEYSGVRVEIFRLNEVGLWYEVLKNPEACCNKWTNEADYIMPILTPELLDNFHGGAGDEDEGGSSLLPTSPLLNHFIYNLARARYTENGCRNTMIRPLIPLEYLKGVGQSQVVRRDPLLRCVWIPLKEERVLGRVKGMLTEFSKGLNH
eukprot:TRINITY_DN5232_c0_g1_i1.p1 TRINITY_DN5232_c0_g1~~TRINITY_DN5232_c0_g1_i1.p1  ORF type:complete len:445 (-),score=113.80 TRINITY_DN5232_c0_g1_i1:2759-4093(-)